MSSPEDCNDSDPNTALSKTKHGEKKKRVRACDMCRRRKVRCDGDRMPDGLCTNCKTYDYKCTYAPKKRAVDPEYIQNLETQLAQAQEALRLLSARLDASDGQHSSEPVASRHSSPSSASSTFPRSCGPQSPNGGHRRFPPLPDAIEQQEDIDPSEDELDAENSIQRDLRVLLDRHGHKQFVGKSSSVLLLQQALNMKEAANNSNNLGMPSSINIPNCGDALKQNPWIQPTPCDYKLQDFPPPDLMNSLIDLYFQHSNILLPLLNSVIFRRDLDAGLHLRDESFGSVVLLVCAIGSRYSADDRVLLDSVVPSENPHARQAAGWRWFRCVQETRKMFDLRVAGLFDLQVPALAAIYYYGSPTPHAASATVAYGLRLAMDLGAHKRKVYKPIPNVEDELLKRAFWVMVVLDRTLSSVLGRPCCVQDEDYDLAFPIECDDEYWCTDDPKLAFQQPAGKPALVTAFIHLIRLNQIQGCTLRTVYATNKSKAIWGMSDECQPHLVALLDSSLNKWIDSLPAHLKWDPNMSNETFMHQSALLHSTYYHLQITVHRSFIPVPSKTMNNGNMSLPSLTICTNAARACIHTLEAQFKRSVHGGYQNLVAMFNAGIVLVLNIWATKHSGGMPTKSTKDLEDIFKVICMLKALEPRLFIASRIVECMKEIAAIGNVPFPGEDGNPRRGTKRTRDGDDIYQSTAHMSHSAAAAAANGVDIGGFEPRVMAGSQRVHQQQQQQQQQQRAMNSSPSSSSLSSASVPSPPSYMAPPPPPPPQPQSGMGPTDAFGGQWMSSEEAFRIALGMTGSPGGSGSSAYGVGAGPSYALPQQPPQHQPHGQGFAQSSMFAPPEFPVDFSGSAHTYAMPPVVSPDVWQAASTSAAVPAAHTPPQQPPQTQQPRMDDPMAASYEPQYFDSDILAMLSSAPTSLEWGDWGTYLNNLTDVDNVRDISNGVSHL